MDNAKKLDQINLQCDLRLIKKLLTKSDDGMTIRELTQKYLVKNTNIHKTISTLYSQGFLIKSKRTCKVSKKRTDVYYSKFWIAK